VVLEDPLSDGAEEKELVTNGQINITTYIQGITYMYCHTLLVPQ